MKNTVKNVLIAVVGVIAVVVLFRFAWVLAGWLLKLLFSLLIFAVLLGLAVYFYRQFKQR